MMMGPSLPPLPSPETLSTLGALLEVIGHPKQAKDNFEKLKEAIDELHKAQARLESMTTEFDARQKQDKDEIAAAIQANTRKTRELEKRDEQLARKEAQLAVTGAEIEQQHAALDQREKELDRRDRVIRQFEHEVTVKNNDVANKLNEANRRMAVVEQREAKLRAALD